MPYGQPTAERNARIVARLQAGESFAEVANSCALTEQSIRNIYRKAGYYTGPDKELRAARNAAIYEARKSGRTLQSVGDEFGTGKERVRQICAEIDRVKARAAWRAHEIDTVNLPDRSIASLGLSVRATNVLSNAGIETLSQLLCVAPDDLLRTPNCGRLTFLEIKAALADLGVRL
jgi:hypothetical protein